MSYSNCRFPQRDLLGVKLQNIAEEVNLIKENRLYSCLCYHVGNVCVYYVPTNSPRK